MTTIDLVLPRLLPWQEQVKRERKRFNVGCLGRRSGKTVLGQDLCCEPDVLRYPVGWFAPTYKDMLEVWRAMAETLLPVAKRISASDFRIENIAGGVLEFWSMDNGKAGRSRKYKRVIVDECAFVPNLLDSWNMAIRPTLADYTGDAYFFSTPKGRNGFWQLWAKSDENWQSWQMPSSVNPTLQVAEIEEMRRGLPERIFAQEIQAAFLEDAGGVFRRVMDAATSVTCEPESGHQYIFGVDWGRTNDFTVISVIDATDKRMVYLDRFNQIDYRIQVSRLKALVDRYKPDAIVAESNSMGGPLVEQLQWEDMPVQPFQTTNSSKAAAIDGLALAFERGDLRILNDVTLVNELQAYESDRLPSGLIRYGAPEGMHDDTVMSLALAWYGCSTTVPLMW